MADEETRFTTPPATPPADASAGRRAVSETLGDRYQIVGKLGAGAFGEVYEAIDTSLQRRVAVKRIRLDSFGEGPELEEVKRRFAHEAQVAAKLRHPNVVTIHDIAAKGSSSFMVLELVSGQTLQTVLREKGRLPLDETLRLLSQAAAALDYAHSNGVVHRDVKPANLMVEPSGHVKVMDFGIAKASASGNITRTGAIVGTPNYMAPEQARGEAVDGRADLFSLGCVLYECLTGRRPFAGDNVTAILLKILNEPPPALDFAALGLPRALEEVLRRALAKTPDQRYASGQLLIDAARRAASGADASAPPPTVTTAQDSPTVVATPTRRAEAATTARGKRPAWMAAGVVGIGALAFGALVWGVAAARRSAGGSAAAEAPVSQSVTREKPGLLGRLTGAPEKLRITVATGTTFRVRLETALSSETARPGQPFSATTSATLLVDGHEVFPAGSRLDGHVSHAAGAGKVSGRGELTLEFDRIASPGGRELVVELEPVDRKARSGAKKDAVKIGGAAGVGAVVGGIFGGKKGAVIGGAVGGSAGTGAVLATKGEEVVLPAGTVLDLRLRAPLTVTLNAAAK